MDKDKEAAVTDYNAPSSEPFRLHPQNRQRNSRLRPNADSAIGATTASFAFFATRVATVRTRFKFFPHRTNGALVQSRVTDIGYYIRSKLS
jgi:hypothetical protein